MRKGPERALQQAVADFLYAALPPATFWTAIPGGDGRRTLAPGYRGGTPDMLIVYRGAAFFIELKALKGRVQYAQLGAQSEIRTAGGAVVVCRSVEEVETALVRWEIPLRATTGARLEQVAREVA